MDLRSIGYAVTLGEELHFGRAARRHFISAQPYGQHIRRLEREVGTELFTRTSRTVQVTPAGRRFIAQARAVLQTLDEMCGAARDDTIGDEVGDDEVLRLGVLGFGLGEAWSAVRRALLAQLPTLSIAHHDLDFTTQYDAIRDGVLDAGFVHHTVEIDGLRFDPVLSSPRVVVVPAASPLADADRLTLAELDGQVWLRMAGAAPGLREWLGPAGDPGRGSPEVRLPSTIASAVATTGRFSWHAADAERYYPRSDVRYIRVDLPDVRIAIATRVTDDRPAVRALRATAALPALVAGLMP